MKVEIWSDVACPWCYIGKRHFEAALAEFPQREQVDVIWRSYQLDPNAPRDSKQTTGEALAKKFGGPEKVKAMNERVTQVAAEAGLEYHLDTAIYDNTFDAHRLIHFAAHKNLQDEAKERLLKAHFTEGAAVSDINELVRLGTEIGLDADELRGALESDAYTDEVKADFQRGSMFGVQGVPFFAIDEKYGISGAQPSQVFAEVLTKAWSESHPLINFSGSTQDAGVCEGDNCAIPQND